MVTSDQKIDVLIVGAGPAGLMMACQLAIQGIPFRIIDKKLSPTTNSGALILQARSIEIFNHMGISETLIQEGIIAKHINFIFNGKQIYTLPLKEIGTGLSKFPYFLMVKQEKTEQLLTKFINDRGFNIERGFEFLQLNQNEEEVTVQIQDPDGKPQTIRSKYLIAADGGRSHIRQQLKIPFIGKAHQKSLFIIDCKSDAQLTGDDIYVTITNKTISGFFPLTNGKWRIDGTIPTELSSIKTLTFDHVEENLSERIRMDAKIHDPDWFSVCYSRQHHATSFQKNRCFLIGDAAHIHSPIGAQGMNTGLQDAFNLSWKIAFVLNLKAKPTLLTTYTPERLPVVKNTIRTTDTIFNLLTSDSFFNRNFRIYLLPVIIRKLFPFIAERNPISRYIFKSISQIGIRYRESALSIKPSIGFFPSFLLRPGDRVPYVLFNENGREVNIQEKFKGTGYHLLILSTNQPSEQFIRRLEKYCDRLTFEIFLYSSLNNKLFKALNVNKNGLLLIRPDLHIALQTNTLNIRHIENYLNHL